MALSMALGGLSLGAAPLNARSALGCTDGLRAQAAPAVAAPLRTATTAEVRIRFTRLGRIKSPFYRLVVMDSRTRRDGRPLEFLGWYNPLKKETQLDGPAIKKWLDQGAQPTETVANLLKKAMIMQQEGPKRVYKQLSTKDAAAAKAEKAAAIKKAQAAKADKAKAAAAAAAAAAKEAAAAAKAAAAEAAKAAPAA